MMYLFKVGTHRPEEFIKSLKNNENLEIRQTTRDVVVIESEDKKVLEDLRNALRLRLGCLPLGNIRKKESWDI